MKRVVILTIVVLMTGSMAYAGNGDLIVNGNLSVGSAIKYADDSTQTTAWLPTGTIIMCGGVTAPAGWLLADGSAVSRTTYAALFAAIGTAYGVGDGSTTFNLPDFRGVFPKGAGTTNRVAGKDASGNYYSGTLGAYGQDQLQGHKHPSGWYGPRGAAGTASVFATNDSSYSSVDTGVAKTDGTNGTPRTGHTTEPQSVGVNFIIKY